MFCDQCGKEIPDGARFCDYCGAPIAQPEPPRAADKPRRKKRAARDQDAQWVQPAPKKKGGKLLSLILIPVVVAAGVFVMKAFSSGDQGGPAPQEQPPLTSQTQEYTPEERPQEPAPQTLQAEGAPTLSDFDWYPEVKANGLWADATMLEDFDQWTGTWKGMNAYMEGTEYEDIYARELFTAHISGTAEDAQLVMELHEMYWSGDSAPSDESGTQLEYSGGWNQEMEAVYLTGSGDLVLDHFFTYEGRDFAWCFMLTPSGDMADVLLTRP